MEKIKRLIRKRTSSTLTWTKENKVEAIVLAGIILLAALLRLHKIDQYMTFLGDEGRDAIVVRRLLVDFDPILVGPGTSIGNMYLGPLYYYLMAPALLLANFSPVGPAVMIALFGLATVWLVWYVARQWFPTSFSKGELRRTSLTWDKINIGALVAAFLYAIAPTVIIYSRSSWNPNIMPFFALLMVYAGWKMWTEHNWKWMIMIDVSFAFILQSHYLGLLLAPITSILWIIVLISILNNKKELKSFLKYSALGFVIFFALMSPLLIFDARHDWRNFEAIRVFFTQRQTTVSARPWTALPNIMPIREEFLTRIFAGYNSGLGKFFSYLILAAMTWILGRQIFKKSYWKGVIKGKLKSRVSGYTVLAMWAVTAFVGLGVYKQEIYDHYYGFIYAAPFLFTAGISNDLIARKKKVGLPLVVFLTIAVAVPNLLNTPIRQPGNRQLERSEAVSQKMIDESGGEKFNIAVIAERNYEGAYQYYLERKNANFVIIDPQKADETIADQLFVVCELPKEKCDPTHNDKAEVANFGWSRVDEEWDVFGITLYRLVHSQDK